jgi:hypothetical protein
MWPAQSAGRTLADAVLPVPLAVAACDHDDALAGPRAADPALSTSVPPPASLVSIWAGGGPLSLWPYTCADLAGTPQDPINLLFAGRPDPREIRATLFALAGDRSAGGLPNVALFDCT